MQTVTNISQSTRSGIGGTDLEPEIFMQNLRKFERKRWERHWTTGITVAPEWFEELMRVYQEIMDKIKHHNARANGSLGDQASGMQPERAEAQKQEQQTMRTPQDSQKSDSFRRERGRLESERQAQTKAMHTTMYTLYERQWSRLTTMNELRWDSFPWPTPTMPSTPAEITAAAIHGYILSPDFPESAPTRPITTRVDEYIQRWHPDRLGGSLFAKVVEEDREMVLEGAWAVIIGLKDIQRELEARGREAAEWKATEAKLLGEKVEVERELTRLFVAVQSKEEEIYRRERDVRKHENENSRHGAQTQGVYEAKPKQERRRGEEEEQVKLRKQEEEQRKKYHKREQQSIVEGKHKEKARLRNVTGQQIPGISRDPPRDEQVHQNTDDVKSALGHSPSATSAPRPSPTSSTPNPLLMRPDQTKYTEKIQPPIAVTTPPEPPASTPTSTATPPSLYEESWAQRQTEFKFAEKQREGFRREQERLESERQARTKRTRTPKGAVNPIFATHHRQWESLSTLGELRWGAFPWPLLKPPSSPHEITLAAINAYIISPERDGTQTTKDCVKEHLRQWHPDRFETKFLGRVVRSEQETVKLGAAAVTQCLSTLLTQLNTRTSYA